MDPRLKFLFLNLGVLVYLITSIIGSVVALVYNDFYELLGQEFPFFGHLFTIVLCALASCNCILGIVAGYRSSEKALRYYVGLSWTMLLLEGVLFVIIIIIYFDDGSSWIDKIEAAMNIYGIKGHEQTTVIIDTIQRKNRCCGSTSPYEWMKTSFGLEKTLSVPESCYMPACKVVTCPEKALLNLNTTRFIYDKPCFEVLQEGVHAWTLMFGVLFVSIVIAQMLSSQFGITFYRSIPLSIKETELPRIEEADIEQDHSFSHLWNDRINRLLKSSYTSRRREMEEFFRIENEFSRLRPQHSEFIPLRRVNCFPWRDKARVKQTAESTEGEPTGSGSP